MGATGACTERGGDCVAAGLELIGAAAGPLGSTGVDGVGTVVAGFETAEPALSRLGFVPGTVFSGFGTLLTVVLDSGWEFPTAPGFAATSAFRLFGAGVLEAELIEAGAGDLTEGAAGFLGWGAATGVTTLSLGL